MSTALRKWPKRSFGCFVSFWALCTTIIDAISHFSITIYTLILFFVIIGPILASQDSFRNFIIKKLNSIPDSYHQIFFGMYISFILTILVYWYGTQRMKIRQTIPNLING